MKKLFYIIAVLSLSMGSCGSSESTADKYAHIPQEADKEPSSGEKIFINNCLQCHSINKDKTGPKLAGVMQRWNNDTVKIRSYIRNSQAMIQSGDAYTKKLFEDWNHTLMPAFTSLTDGEINQLLDHINKGLE